MDLKIHRRAKKFLINVLLMLNTGAPLRVIAQYIRNHVGQLFSRKHRQEVAEFRKIVQSKKISHDYFRKNIPSWLNTFEKYRLAEKARLDILEIGSFEGMSALFFLTHLPNSYITCVDTWEGSDEHEGDDCISSIEKYFDSNLAEYSARVKKFRQTSVSFFQNISESVSYDVIYIDGSHYVDDVIIDAIKGFELLNVDGIMIFDDYLWKVYKNWRDNPCSAINAFLRIKKDDCKLVFVGNQVQIQKIADSKLMLDKF